MWEAITAIVATLLFFGAVGKMISWILDRPKIELHTVSSSWRYTYASDGEKAFAQIMLEIQLKNVGKENTVVSVSLKRGGKLYEAGEEIEIRWDNKTALSRLFFDIPAIDGLPRPTRPFASGLRAKTWQTPNSRNARPTWVRPLGLRRDSSSVSDGRRGGWKTAWRSVYIAMGTPRFWIMPQSSLK